MNRNKVLGIYLAAGNSKRMGMEKLNLPFKGSTVGNMGLTAAVESELDSTIVVTKEADCPKWISELLKKDYAHRWELVTCGDAYKGQSCSLKSGLRKAIHLGYEAVLILLADQPFVTSEMINRFIEKYLSSTEDGFISAVFKEIPRPPVLFTKSTFDRLLDLEGDEGARKLIRKGAGIKGNLIYFNDFSLFVDIDTMEDYMQFK
ncbi:NTP transferase domain-containing protein [Heyndrickxia acidicola]|uniref:Nucleotidyltransferase family protein n=1 Tax=Heyndrickxia acidicola TaxID=209389 RepID=A0ABU6MAA9_9BACI|nr:nucleotidyltransferase family protein [Heyndrickxia acidicola]MED1201595.1 nucleotidyltransferase family protein [Heyndrickxia acidicola]